MRPTVSEYWEGQVAALRSRSVCPESIDRSEAITLSEPDNPYKGIIDARVWFEDHAFLDVYEHLQIDEAGIPHRTLYSYHLSVDDRDVERHDYDPDLDEPLRYHVNIKRDKKIIHIPSQRVTLVSFVEQCWGIIADCRDQID